MLSNTLLDSVFLIPPPSAVTFGMNISPTRLTLNRHLPVVVHQLTIVTYQDQSPSLLQITHTGMTKITGSGLYSLEIT